jgi:hypothetical protein
VIRERLARDRSSGDAAAIVENREEQRIDRRPFLEDLEHLLGTSSTNDTTPTWMPIIFVAVAAPADRDAARGNTCPHRRLEEASAIDN